MDLSEIRALPIAQKIEIIGQLWDDVVDSDAPIELSPAVIAEMKRRSVELRENPSIGIDRDEMWRRVDERRSSNG